MTSISSWANGFATGHCRIDSFIQWGMLTEQTLRAQPRFKRLEARLAHDTEDRRPHRATTSGRTVNLRYWRNTRTTRASPTCSDDCATSPSGSVRSSQSDSEFDAFFPQLSTRTDMEAARAQEAAAQLGLFG